MGKGARFSQNQFQVHAKAIRDSLCIIALFSQACSFDELRCGSIQSFSEVDIVGLVVFCSPSSTNPRYSSYSCFEKGCPTKPYATIPKGIIGNGGSWSVIEVLGVSATIEENSTNNCIYACSFLLGKHLEPQSINAKLFLPIIPIGIVAYAFKLLWDNLCRNSCIRTITLLD